MNKIITKKNTYLLFLFVVCLFGFIIVPTYAKFGSSYTTPDDVVGLSFNFNLSISNIEEYEEIVVPSGGVVRFNVQVTNNTGSLLYYGIWYKMVDSSQLTDNIIIAKDASSTVGTTGSINNNVTTTVTIVIENASSSKVKINIGVGNSSVSTSSIEYLDGRKLITDSWSSAVQCVTGNETTLYAMLNTALKGSSTTEATTCTLLTNLTENVSADVALYDTTIDLNDKTLTGYIKNANEDSTITLKNGTITGASTFIVQNYGTLYITDGTYSNSGGTYVVANQSTGVLYITGGEYNLTTSSGGSAIVNTTSSVCSISNATVTSNGYGVANLGGTVKIDTANISVTDSTYPGVLNNNSGSVKIYSSSVTGGLTNSSGEMVAFDGTSSGMRSGQVAIFWHYSSTIVQLALFNINATRCATWTIDNGQDDLVWTDTSSYTNTYQTYLTVNINYSEHNSTTSSYATHCYNGNTIVAAYAWYWNFDH